MTNESLSIESTVESPSKPHQETVPAKNNKSIFLVHFISNGDSYNKISPNLEIQEPSKNINQNINLGKKKLSSNLLDFDEVLNLVLNKEKDKKIKSKKKHKKKLLGFKRKRLIKPKEIKSKTNLYLIFF